MKRNLMLSLLMLCALTLTSNLSYAADCGCGKTPCECQQMQNPCDCQKANPCPCETGKAAPCCDDDCDCGCQEKPDCGCKDECSNQKKQSGFRRFFHRFGF